MEPFRQKGSSMASWIFKRRRKEVMWHTAKYGDTHSEFVLCIYPIQSAHTQQWTHTHREHTWSSGQPFMLRRPGSSWGFDVLLKGTSVVVLRVERALYIHSPHLQFLPARDSNSQPLDYESDSLTIRPRLPYITYISLSSELGWSQAM